MTNTELADELERLDRIARYNVEGDAESAQCSLLGRLSLGMTQIIAALRELDRLTTPRPAAEWTEADGRVLSCYKYGPIVVDYPGQDYWTPLPCVEVPRG